MKRKVAAVVTVTTLLLGGAIACGGEVAHFTIAIE